MPIDHVGFEVADLPARRAFYDAVLLRARRAADARVARTRSPRARPSRSCGSSPAAAPAPRLRPRRARAPGARVAVDAAHAAGLRAGGRDDGAPGPRPQYGERYYAPICAIPTACASRSSPDPVSAPFRRAPPAARSSAVRDPRETTGGRANARTRGDQRLRPHRPQRLPRRARARAPTSSGSRSTTSATSKTLAHLLKYDSILGPLDAEVTVGRGRAGDPRRRHAAPRPRRARPRRAALGRPRRRRRHRVDRLLHRPRERGQAPRRRARRRS